MRTVGLLWGSLLLSGVLCISGPDEITIPYGGTLSVTCSYDDGYQSYSKYWCKGEGWKSCEILIESEGRTWLGNGRYTISDSHQSITITAHNMMPEDSDVYWCGITVSGVDKMSRVNVNVRPGLCSGTSDWSSMVIFPDWFEMLSEDDVVEVSCREEYESRTFLLECQWNAELYPETDETPCILKCRKLELGKNINVTPEKEYYDRDEEVTLTCPEGYKPSHGRARCIRDGETNTWNVSNVSCMKIPTPVKCRKLELGKNINVTPEKEYYDRDEEVTLTCPEGYKPSHSRARCIRDGETNTWNVSDVSCIPTPVVTSVVTPTVTLDMDKATNSSWKRFLVSCMFGLLPSMAVKLLAILVVIAVRASAFIRVKREQDMEIALASLQGNTKRYHKVPKKNQSSSNMGKDPRKSTNEMYTDAEMDPWPDNIYTKTEIAPPPDNISSNTEIALPTSGLYTKAVPASDDIYTNTETTQPPNDLYTEMAPDPDDIYTETT